MAVLKPGARGDLVRAARVLIQTWALLGGAVLCLLVLMNVYSVVAGALLGTPFPGDFEMTEVGVAVAVFAFLPYAQLTGANVTADIFTDGASPRTVALLRAVASLVAFCFAALLAWRMWDGMLDQMTYGYTTAILQFPHWIAFLPILVSLLLLTVASIITAAEAVNTAMDA
ncbi:MAG: TRAP transporter small permease [Alphaproteobacteria bacterium]